MTLLRGNAVIGQSGGPTRVINESLVGVIREARRHSQIRNLYGAVHGIAGILDQDFVDLSKETPRTLSRVASTPSAALGSVRRKPTADDCAAIVKIFRAHDVRYFFYIGGNDSAETANIIDEQAREGRYDFRVCHIPKTIDNDLLVTDHCPGYGSAARYVALALMGDNLDNRALKGVKIDVIMGRHAGFLTAAAGLGRRDTDDGPHLIYVPEVPFSMKTFCADVDRCLTKWGRCVVAVSEGIQDQRNRPVLTGGSLDSHGNVQLSGSGALGDFLANELKVRLGVKRVRADTFGYSQRSFPAVVSAQDAREARGVGVYGVRCLVKGERSASVAIRRVENPRRKNGYGCSYFTTALRNVARDTRRLNKKFISRSGSDITGAFRKYALPLIGELPEVGRISASRIRKKKV
jgi:6-phosphofructokinase 1